MITDHIENDPDRIETREAFGAALTALRLRAGLTIRDLAVRADLPTATVGGYVKGRHLPGAGQTAQFRKVLEACGVSDPEVLGRWQDALSRVRSSTDGRLLRRGPDGAPYPGLRPYGPDDASVFFGREAFLAEVLERLGALRDSTAGPKLLFLVGASGSGKSSLLRAGVQPAVADGVLDPADGAWPVAVMVPGSDPVAALGRALTGVHEPRLLIVDQFEELYTLAEDEPAARFVAALADLGPGTSIVAGLRADLFPRAAADPVLVPSLQDWQMVVPPLTEAELRSAVVGPAAAWQVTVDEALVEVVIGDIIPAGRPGPARHQNALPLLSHALLAAWQHHARGRLTLQQYRAAGGIGGAVQQSAEQAYAELSGAGQELARRLFLRLVTVDDDHVTAKRRISRGEMPTGEKAIDDVIERFVARRLVTVDEQHIEISHDALLTAWPRLADWITADHAGLRLHRRLTAAANEWHTEQSDPQLLLRGNLLTDVIEWARDPDHRASMNGLEWEYLGRSAAAREAEQHAARRRISVLRRLVAALMVLVVVSTGLAGYALRASKVAADQRAQADQARDEALSRQVAISALRAQEADPALAEQLALASYRISPTTDARSALFDTATEGVVHRLVGPSGPTQLRINPAGTLIAISNAADGSVDLRRYEADRPGPLLGVVPAAGPGKVVFAMAFSPDGRTLAVGGESGRVSLADVREPARPRPLGLAPGAFTGAVEALAFAPDGAHLVAGGAGPALRAWGPGHDGWQAASALPVAGGATTVQAVAYSPDGRTLAVGDTSGTLRFWPASRLRDAPTAIPLGGSTLNTVAWSPDGRSVLAGARDGTATIVDRAAPAVRTRLATGFTSWVNAAAWSPRGNVLAVGGSNNTIAIFDGITLRRLTTIANAAQITSVTYAPDGAELHVAAADGTVRGFPAVPRTLRSGDGALFALGFDREGDRLAVASTGSAGRPTVWSTTDSPPSPVRLPANPPWFGPSAGTAAISSDGRLVVTGNRGGTLLLVDGDRTVSLRGATKLVESVQFSPDARTVAAGSDDGFVHLWDVADPAHPRTLPALASGGLAAAVAFSPDGRFLAAASVDHRIHRWDVGNPASAIVLPALGGFGNYAWSVAFSPDSRLLAAGGADDTIRVWDVSDPPRGRLLGTPLSGPTHYVFGVAFSPDGASLSASGGDGAVWTWRVAGGPSAQPVAVLHGANPNGKTYAIGYTPDGSSLVAVGSAGVVTFWPTDVRQVVRTICAAGGDPLTAAEWVRYVPGSAYRRTCP